MDTSAFETLAEETLDALFDALDDAIGDDADVDLENAILTIELEDGRQYVINKNAAAKEIWVSSPISGAAHYGFDETAGAWVSARDGRVMHETLAQELAGVTGKSVELP